MDPEEIKVLVVDDESSIRVSLVGYLDDMGFDVVSAETGEEALELARTQPFDVAIVDMRLPGIDGATFITRIHGERRLNHFLVHTGSVNFHLSPALLAVGLSPDDVLLKPVRSLDDFIKAIERLLLS